jgi:histidine phosphotransferase ChpT
MSIYYVSLVAGEALIWQPRRMSGILDMRVVELLTARLCHDLAGPIAALGNGAEMLADEDPDFAAEAVRLIADSAVQAASRLRFYRFAYGFGGDGAAAGGAPSELAVGFFAATTIVCDYATAVCLLPLPWQKLACNLLLVAADGLPRGGTLALDTGARGLVLDGVGEAATLAPELLAAMSSTIPTAALTPRTVQARFTALLACGLGQRLLTSTAEAGRFRIAASAATD